MSAPRPPGTVAAGAGAGSAAREHTVTLTTGQIHGAVLAVSLGSLLLLAVAHGWLWGWAALFPAGGSLTEWAFLLPLLLVAGTVVHEGLHGAGYMIFGSVPRRLVRYGFRWRRLATHAHCGLPIAMGAYRLAVLLPAVVLGIAPAVAGMALNLGWLTWSGCVLLGAAGGDVRLLWALRGFPAHSLVRDDPDEIGCTVTVPPAGP